MIKQAISRAYSNLVNFTPEAPPAIARNFSTFDNKRVPEFKRLIADNLLRPLSEHHVSTTAGEEDIETHISGRLNRFRNSYVPWINSVTPIKGARILEIGSGTGASTQALAEQGGQVTGIDVDQKVLDVASFRLRYCGQNADLRLMNAENISEHFAAERFDMVIFFAALEHMTTGEKISSLKQAYSLLTPGGALFVLEAPNRLWFYDFHTAFLPFYLWLPDDLAVQYAAYSDRELIRDAIKPNLSATDFARWGRGVSYHEFELAGIPHHALSSATGVFDYNMRKKAGKRLFYRLSLNHSYKKILAKLCPPHVAPCFREPFLDLCIRRSTTNG